MTKIRKRRIISSITAAAIAFSCGTASTLNAYGMEDNTPASGKLQCDYVEELPDGGKKYVYVIDGAEHTFPVPPEGFSPLTASDEQLEAYGFPPRPGQDNTEDYNDWVQLMSCYKSTAVPEIDLEEGEDGNRAVNGGIAAFNAIITNDTNYTAGYAACLQDGGRNFFHVQGDFVQPTITGVSGTCANIFAVGFDTVQGNSGPGAVAGTKCIGRGEAQAYYHCYGKNGTDKYLSISSLTFKPGDKVHVYVSYQRANNIFNYYIVNVTTGKQISDIVEYSDANYFDGKYACWLAARYKYYNGALYNLGKFTDVSFTSCKAMMNISDTWTALGDFDTIMKCSMKNNSGATLAYLSSVISKTQFSCKWQGYK